MRVVWSPDGWWEIPGPSADDHHASPTAWAAFLMDLREMEEHVNFCMAHWDKLRAAVTAAGLDGFVAEGGQLAARNLASELADGRTVDNYDPLMAAAFAIWGNAMSAVGVGLMAADPATGKPPCPICFLTSQHEADCADPACDADFERWIEYAVSEQAELVRTGGLGQ